MTGNKCLQVDIFLRVNKLRIVHLSYREQEIFKYSNPSLPPDTIRYTCNFQILL